VSNFRRWSCSYVQWTSSRVSTIHCTCVCGWIKLIDTRYLPFPAPLQTNARHQSSHLLPPSLIYRIRKPKHPAKRQAKRRRPLYRVSSLRLSLSNFTRSLQLSYSIRELSYSNSINLRFRLRCLAHNSSSSRRRQVSFLFCKGNDMIDWLICGFR
jgi:hypothetical protein